MVWNLFVFMIFGLLWIVAFIKAKGTFIVMVSASSYYFDSNKFRDGEADVGMAFRFTYFYHLGSLAFGSFIIAVIQVVKICFLYFAEKARDAAGENFAVKAIVCCAKCCLNIIEALCDYIN